MTRICITDHRIMKSAETEIVEFFEQYVGPLVDSAPDGLHGEGWSILVEDDDWYLEIEDEKLMTLVLLRWS